ncbi:MAG: outer membrane beta-barrel protein [Alphaproteobacteria bacterium]
MHAYAQDAQAESVRGVGIFEKNPIGIELDRLIELPFDLLEDGGYDPDEEREDIISTFIAFPKFEVEFTHTDNLFRATEGKSELITVYRPSLVIASDWDNHSLSFSGSTSFGRHKNHPLENFEDYNLATALNLVVDDFTSASASLSHTRGHGARGDIDDPGEQFSPDISYVNSLVLGFTRAIPDGLQLNLQLQVSKVSFENNGPRNNSDRWETDYQGSARIGWEIEEGTTVFVQPRAFFSRFRVKVDDFGTIRDYNEYEMTAGVRLNATPITFLEFLAGLSTRKNKDEQFEDTVNYLSRGTFVWNPTSVTTLSGTLNQTFEGAAAEGVSGTLTRSLTTSVDWTPQDDWILTAETTFRVEEFEGIGTNTSRQAMILGLVADWAINRNVYSRLSLTREIQDGDLATDEMTENRVSLRVGAEL